jgi:hypothetical protein
MDYTPAQEEDRYVFRSLSRDNQIIMICPCEYLRGWTSLEKFHQNQRKFERNYGKFIKARITISYKYFEKQYKENPKLYSDEVEENVEAWRNANVYDGGTTQYRKAEVVNYPGEEQENCAYLEYGTSMHGEPTSAKSGIATGLHQRKLSCPVSETEFRDGLYVSYSLNVRPGHENGRISPRKAMRDIEKTVKDISKSLVFEMNEVKTE